MTQLSGKGHPPGGWGGAPELLVQLGDDLVVFRKHDNAGGEHVQPVHWEGRLACKTKTRLTGGNGGPGSREQEKYCP